MHKAHVYRKYNSSQVRQNLVMYILLELHNWLCIVIQYIKMIVTHEASKYDSPVASYV